MSQGKMNVSSGWKVRLEGCMTFKSSIGKSESEERGRGQTLRPTFGCKYFKLHRGGKRATMLGTSLVRSSRSK